MKNFDEELTALVKTFADFEKDTYCSKKNMDSQKVEAQAIALFTHYLTKDGFHKESINKHYKTLALWFHTDKLANASLEKNWLNNVLCSEGKTGGAFKLVAYVREELLKPKNQVENNSFANVSSVDELLQQLNVEKQKASTRTQSALIQSIIDVLKSAKDYHSGVAPENSLWLKGVLHSLPYISSGICVGFYVTELALLYALVYLISAGGEWLESSSKTRWQMLGRQMQSFSACLQNAVLALLTGMASLNFMALHQIRYIGVGLGTALYHYVIPAIEENPKTKKAEQTKASNVSKNSAFNKGPLPLCSAAAQVLAPQHLLGGKEFPTLETKLIALPLEHYKAAQQEQYFSTWRLGHTKGEAVDEAIKHLQSLDKAPPSTEKFKTIEGYLAGVAARKLFKDPSSHSAKALAAAINLARQLAFEPSPLAVTPPLMIEHQPTTEKEDTEDDFLGLNTAYSV